MTDRGESEEILVPARLVVPLDDSRYYLFLPEPVRKVLRTALEELRDRILTSDPSTYRLRPPAHPDTPELEQQWQQLMGDQLLASRLTMLDTVDEALRLETLGAEQVTALMQAANALRLTLATELGFDRDDAEDVFVPGDPRQGRAALYDLLGLLVASCVYGLEATL